MIAAKEGAQGVITVTPWVHLHSLTKELLQKNQFLNHPNHSNSDATSGNPPKIICICKDYGELVLSKKKAKKPNPTSPSTNDGKHNTSDKRDILAEDFNTLRVHNTIAKEPVNTAPASPKIKDCNNSNSNTNDYDNPPLSPPSLNIGDNNHLTEEDQITEKSNILILSNIDDGLLGYGIIPAIRHARRANLIT